MLVYSVRMSYGAGLEFDLKYLHLHIFNALFNENKGKIKGFGSKNLLNASCKLNGNLNLSS